MNSPLTDRDHPHTDDTSIRHELVDVLENYLAALERGETPDLDAFLATHPELAKELRPYLSSLHLLHATTREMRLERANSNSARVELYSRPARQIGDYRIVREIGRGGMGIVYEAHQVSLNRCVALKILPFAAVLDQRQIARFRNEAQAAAQLHHPHIVPVFAVGQEQGVYYYAMQYVDGQSLEQAIDEVRKDIHKSGERSTVDAGTTRGCAPSTTDCDGSKENRSCSIIGGDFIRTAARIGKEAAEALQNAHEYGIVHRDVKPSNLLIDGQGKLWVTDFGLARIQSDRGVTITGDVVGTLRYMSPEQASGQSALVDARTDVYSLGVTLYELLTQRHAFPGENRQEVLCQIERDEPVPPRRHNPAIPLDLETIVLTAMAKSRDERYASAQALADDLERFLAGKPTLARRPTLADRAAKWARRHKSFVALCLVGMFLLSAVSAVGMALLAREQLRTSTALEQAERSASAAEQNYERAERHFRQARGAVDQLGVRIADRLLEIPGAESVRRDLLVDTLGYYRQFATEADDDPHLKYELAVTHGKSAVIASKVGATTEAIAEYETAIELLSELASNESGPTLHRSQLASMHNNLGLLLASRGNLESALRHYRKAITVRQQLLAQDADNAVFATGLAESRANLGLLLDEFGDSAGAEKSLRSAVNVLQRATRATPDEPKHARELAIAFNNLSCVVRKRDTAAAEQYSREAITILRRLVSTHSTNQYQDDLAVCLNNLAALMSRKDSLNDAIEWHQQAIVIKEQLARRSPAMLRHRSDLAITLNNLGVAFCRADRTSDAAAPFRRARELLSTLADDYPGELAYHSSLAALLNNQAMALAEAGRHEKALDIYPVAIDSQRECWQALPKSPLMRTVLCKMYYNYGQSLRATGSHGQAISIALARRDLWQKDGPKLLGVATELAEIRKELKETAGIESALDASRQLDTEIVSTLWEAYESGWGEAKPDFAGRFAFLNSNKRFTSLLDKLKTPTNEAERTSNPDLASSSNSTN